MESRRSFLSTIAGITGVFAGYLSLSLFRTAAMYGYKLVTQQVDFGINLIEHGSVSNPKIFSNPMYFFGNAHRLQNLVPIIQEYIKIFKLFDVFVLESGNVPYNSSIFFNRKLSYTDSRLASLPEGELIREMEETSPQVSSLNDSDLIAISNNWWFRLMTILAARYEKTVIFVDPFSTSDREEHSAMLDGFENLKMSINFSFVGGIVATVVSEASKDGRDKSPDFLSLSGLSLATVANLVGENSSADTFNVLLMSEKFLKSDIAGALSEISLNNYREFVSVALLRKIIADNQIRGGNLKDLNAAALYGARHYRIMTIYNLPDEVILWKLRVYELLLGLNRRKVVVSKYDKMRRRWESQVVDFDLTSSDSR